MTPADILNYWFGSESADTAIAEAQKKLWWSKDEAVDADMRSRYGELVAAAASGSP